MGFVPQAESDNQRWGAEMGQRASEKALEGGRAGGRAIVDAAKDGYRTLTGSGTDSTRTTTTTTTPTPPASDDAGEDIDPNTPGIQLRRRNGTSTGQMNWQHWLGGLLGVGGAWLLSSMFGGGWLGTIAFILLAIPGFLMGRGAIGNWLSGIGGGSSSRSAGSTPGRSVTPDRTVDAQSPETETHTQTRTVNPDAREAAMQRSSNPESVQERLRDLNDKVEALYRIGQRSIRGGTLARGAIREIQRNDQRAEEMIERINEFASGVRNEEEMRVLDEMIANGEQRFERLYRRWGNGQLRTDVESEVIMIRREREGGGRRRPLSFDSDRGANETRLGAILREEDREVVDTMRLSRRYDPQRAELEDRESPRFAQRSEERQVDRYIDRRYS